MHIIAVASQKGGSGKTTMAGHLAVMADRAGAGPVALVDTDPQGSLSEWWNARTAETPLFARTSTGRLETDIARMRSISVASRPVLVRAKSGVSAVRAFHHSDRLPCGSVSTSATGPAPERSAWTAR